MWWVCCHCSRRQSPHLHWCLPKPPETCFPSLPNIMICASSSKQFRHCLKMYINNNCSVRLSSEEYLQPDCCDFMLLSCFSSFDILQASNQPKSCSCARRRPHSATHIMAQRTRCAMMHADPNPAILIMQATSSTGLAVYTAETALRNYMTTGSSLFSAPGESPDQYSATTTILLVVRPDDGDIPFTHPAHQPRLSEAPPQRVSGIA